MDFMILTERLIIRLLETNDATDMFNYRSLPDIYRYQSWQPKHIDEVEKFIKENNIEHFNIADKWVQLAVCLKDSGKLIGDIGIHFLEDTEQIELGYTIAPMFQGFGYAIEAVRAVLDYLFKEESKHRVIASLDPDNERSIKLLDKLGFRKEAHFIKSYRNQDSWSDDCVYALLEEEWK